MSFRFRNYFRSNRNWTRLVERRNKGVAARPIGTTLMLIKRIPQGNKLRNVTYIIGDKASGELAVVDLGRAHDLILPELERLDGRLKYLLATHGHVDHVGRPEEISAIKRRFGGRLAAFKTNQYLSRGDTRLNDGDNLLVGDLHITVIHTPGHTDDSVCFLVNEAELFTGDTLYVGRAPKGSRPNKLFNSLHERVLKLPGKIRIWPGHDLGDRPSSTIDRERRTNTVCQMSIKEFRDRRWDKAKKRWVC